MVDEEAPPAVVVTLIIGEDTTAGWVALEPAPPLARVG
jgi:hypothetical protein